MISPHLVLRHQMLLSYLVLPISLPVSILSFRSHIISHSTYDSPFPLTHKPHCRLPLCVSRLTSLVLIRLNFGAPSLYCALDTGAIGVLHYMYSIVLSGRILRQLIMLHLTFNHFMSHFRYVVLPYVTLTCLT